MIKKLKRGLKDIFDEKKSFVEVRFRSIQIPICSTKKFTYKTLHLTADLLQH